MPDRVGQQLGNYRLVKLLGKGGFAEVYLGQHMRLAAKQAAIKILHLLDVDARKFQEEAETTEKLVHPHIVRLLDFDIIEEGTPYLVLDYAPGGSLRSRYPKGNIVPLAQVGAYLKEIVPALQYAHDLHILHRDIKPDNVLIGRQGELLLSDFGIAVLTQTGRTSLSSAYGIGGTPYYMAPETYRGRPVKESDQYALAVVVYEWLCGSVPFSEGDFIQLGYQHAYENVPPLGEKNPAIPSDVEAVILTALAKDPHQRFGSVRAFATAFEQASQVEPSQTLPASRSLPPTDAIARPRPSQPPTELITPPSQSSIQTEQSTPPSQISIPTELSAPSSQKAVPTEAVTPTNQASLPPTQLAAPASQAAASRSKVSRRYWWLLARGLLAILFGLALLAWPRLSLLALVLLFGVYALVDGVMTVIVSLQERRVFAHWWMLFLEGLVGIAAGVIALVWPGITALAFLYLLAAWAILTGVLKLSSPLSFPMSLGRTVLMVLAGLVSVVFGVLIAIQPAAGLLAVVWLIGIYAIVVGVILTIYAFRHRTATPA